jgi:ribosomal protein L29
MSYRRARESWTPTNWEAFLKRAHADANEEEFERLLAEMEPDDLRHVVRELRKELAGARFAAEVNADTVRSMTQARRNGI